MTDEQFKEYQKMVHTKMATDDVREQDPDSNKHATIFEFYVLFALVIIASLCFTAWARRVDRTLRDLNARTPIATSTQQQPN